MDKACLSIFVVALLGIAGAQSNKYGSIRGYGVQDVYDYQTTGWGQEKLDHATLEWKVSGSKVTFNLTIQPEIHELYDWFGVGLKNPSSTVSMADADFAVVRNIDVSSTIISDPVVSHMNTFNSTGNGRPQNNTVKVFDSVSSGHSKSTFEIWVSWTRDLNTSIKEQTLNLTQGGNYTLLYAYGTIKDYQIQHHYTTNRGYGNITLFNNFTGEATVPAKKMGKETLKGGDLQWQVLNDRVIFNLTIDLEATKGCDWYGVALKEPSDFVSMIDAEYFVVKNFSSSQMRLFHMNTFGYYLNGRPTNNSIDELKYEWASQNEGKVSVTWARQLNTSTQGQTLNLTKGSQYTLLFAYGKMTKGVIQKHEGTNRGYGNITLSNTFSGKATIPDQMGQENLKNGNLKWSVSDDNVKFQLTINSTVVSNYDWYGIGLKERSDGISMINATYAVVKDFSNPTLQAMNTMGYTESGRPRNDTGNLFSGVSYKYYSNGDMQMSWTLSLNEFSNSTLDLKEGNNYTLLFAYGKMSGGQIQKHGVSNRGYGDITLSNNFYGNATIPPQLGQEILKNGNLKWNVSQTVVDFLLTVDSSVVSEYDWYGIGLKEAHGDNSMANAEYAVVKNLSNPTLQDMNTVGYAANGLPQNDTKTTFRYVSSSIENGNLVVNWTLGLDTFSNSTLNLTEGGNYTLLFAYGKMSNGTIQRHESTNRGYGNITLSNTFYGKATVPAKKMGKEVLKGGDLHWLVSQKAVEFYLFIDSSVVNDYDWYGVALKEPSSTVSMANAEYAVVKNLSNPTLQAMNTVGYTANGRPQNNTSPYTSISNSTDSKGNLLVSWTLPFSAFNNKTLNLTPGGFYTLLFAYGKMANGTIQKHEGTNRGYGNITLSNDFTGYALHPADKMGNATLKGGTLRWYVARATATFELTVNSSVVNEYDWYGIGLREPSGNSMTDAEYAVVKNLSSPTLQAMNTVGYLENGRPQNDTSYPFEYISYSNSTGNLVMNWTLPLSTFSNSTLKLKEANNYTLLFAYGKMSNGVIQRHESNNRGYGKIVLSNTFSGDTTIPAKKMGKEILKNGNLEWLVSQTAVEFQLTINSTAVSDYDWYGIGLKKRSDIVSMMNAEYAVVKNLSNPTLQAMNTVGYDQSGRPQNQTLNPYKDFKYSTDNGNLVASWKLPFGVFTNNTLDLEIGGEYTLLFAYGKMSNGTIQKHKSSNRGYGNIVLSNNFSGEATIPPTSSGKEALKNGALQWIVSEDNVQFQLTIDSTVVKNYDWYGIGLKEPSSTASMINATYAVVENLSNPKLVAMNTSNYTLNGRPQNYTPSPFTKVSDFTDSNGNLVVNWTMPLNNTNNQPLNLTAKSNYTVLFAYGKMTDGTIQKHESSNRGYGNITLSNYFSGKATVPVINMGQEILKNATFKWHVSNTGADFELSIDPEIVSDYDWYGIGLKEPSKTLSMINAEYTVVEDLSSPKLVAMNTINYTDNGRPQKYNSNPYKYFSHFTNSKGNLVLSWTIDSRTLSNGFLNLTERGEYTLLFAYGKMSDGVIKKHKYTDRGNATILFNNDFSGRATFPEDDSASSFCTLLLLLVLEVFF